LSEGTKSLLQGRYNLKLTLLLKFNQIYKKGLTHMQKNQLRGALITFLGVTLVATSIGSASQAETNTPMTKPSAGSSGQMSAPETKKPLKKTPASASPKPSATSSSESTPATTSTIVDLAVASKQFQTLVTAVKAAELSDTLAGSGPFTLFAPNDQAFAKLPKGTLKKLLKPENKMALQKILKYHLLAGEVMAKDVKSGSVATVEGKNVKIVVSKKGVKINDANVIKTDIKASNGVVHTIDTVLMPPDVKIK
jgi:uncharacterized surface protein with fasciclin (FAS1) repeats